MQIFVKYQTLIKKYQQFVVDGLALIPILQNIGQLNNRYPNGLADEILGNTDIKEENMTMWNEFLGNQILISAVLGWTVAQFLKTVIDMVLNRSFNPERIFGSGGMPSSHSATVCALTTASGMKYGVGSFEFAVSFVLAMIVMYDAMGVRRETGKQAKLLNSVFFENILNLDGVFLQEKLKEYVGHTPLQVAAGAILGILIAVFIG